MKFQLLKEDALINKESNDLPAEFKRGDKSNLMREIREELLERPEEVELLINNMSLNVVAYNIVNGLVAIRVKADSIKDELALFSDYKVIDNKRGTLWLR